jgi:tRNA(Ile)-lysidine synthase
MYRNKLRHELLPYLEREFKPGFGEILRRSARVIRDDYDLLCSLRDRAWQQVTRETIQGAVVFDLQAWRALHPSLQRATVRHAVQHLRWNLRDVSFQHVVGAVQIGREGAAGDRATLPRALMLTVGYTTLTLAEAGSVPPPDFAALQQDRLALTVPGTTLLGRGGRAEVCVVARAELSDDWRNNADPWRAYLDADVLGRELFLRRRKAGDRFCPLGLGGRHKLVSELLVNAKVPAWWRDQVPLLVRGDDEIMWVCGWRVDERAKIGETTSRVAIIHLCVAEQGNERNV